MVDLTNIGTLFAFVLVCLGIPILRCRDPSKAAARSRSPWAPGCCRSLGVVSCLFLMFYLPPASWWRFVGWLVLGLSIYTAYGWARSEVGRRAGRPERTPTPLKFASLGFLTTAVGLFTIPHSAGVGQLFAQALVAGAADHGRSLAGLLLMTAGLALGVGGSTAAARRAR